MYCVCWDDVVGVDFVLLLCYVFVVVYWCGDVGVYCGGGLFVL